MPEALVIVKYLLQSMLDFFGAISHFSEERHRRALDLARAT